MSTLQEYCRKLSTQKLEQILCDHFDSVTEYPIEIIYDIMTILSERKDAEKNDL